MEPWRVQLFGEVEARRGDEHITRFGTRKNAALLALLAWQPGRSVRREVAIEALWPGVDPATGKNRLAVALNALRRLLEPPEVPRGAVLQADRGLLALHAVETDVGAFEAALGRARDLPAASRAVALRDALIAYRGDLLPSGEEDWILPERQRLAGRHERATLELAELSQDGTAFEILSDAVSLSPLSTALVEAALRRALRARRVAEGNRLYRDHARAALRATGQPPGAALRALAAELERASPASTQPPVRAQRERSGLLARLHLHGALDVDPTDLGEILSHRPPYLCLAHPRVARAVEAGQRCLSADPTTHVVVDLVEEDGEDRLGPGVLASTPPGVLLLTDAARAMLERRPPEGWQRHDLGLVDLGLVALPGASPERWSALVLRGSPAPVLSALSQRRDRLPASITRFFGREGELNAIEGAWRDGARLVTLLGPGGSGKTRIALEAARRQLSAPEAPAEVGLMRLADLTAASQLDRALRDAFGLPGAPVSAIEQLRSTLGNRRALVLVDNAEHLVAAVAPWVAALLESMGGVTVLCTSQRLLGVAGETRLDIPPFPVPKPDEDLSRLAHAPAVALFVDRARAARPDFQLVAGNAAAVVAICRRLDGIPLAIELAAAKTSAWPPGRLLQRLGDGLVVCGPQHGRPARQASLEAAITWNVGLLPDDLREVWEALSIFPAPFDTAAAEATLADPLAADRLVELRDAGLLVGEEQDGDLTWRLLAPLRAFAAARLAPEAEATHTARHIQFFFERCTHFCALLKGADPRGARRWLGERWPHLRHLLATAPAELRAQLFDLLATYIQSTSREREVVALVRALLDDPADLSPAARAAVAGVALQTAEIVGDLPLLARANQILLELPPDLDSRAAARHLNAQSMTALARGDFRRAMLLSERALAIFEEIGTPVSAAVMMDNIAQILGLQGEQVRADQLSARALHIYEADHHRDQILRCRSGRSIRAIERDDPDGAELELDAADALIPAGEAPSWWVATGIGRAQIHLHRGELVAAHALLERLATGFRDEGNRRFEIFALQILAQVELAAGHRATALRLATQSVDGLRALGLRYELRSTLATAGRAAALLGEPELGRSYAEEALQLALECDANYAVPEMAFALATALAAQGRWARAAEVWRLVTHLPRWMASDAAAVRDEIARHTPEPARAAEPWQRTVQRILEDKLD